MVRLVAEELLDLPQILSHVVEEDRGCAVAQPVGCNLPHAECPARGAQPQVESAPLENGAPEYPANTNCDPANAIPSGKSNPPRFRGLLNILPLEERRTQASRYRHIVEERARGSRLAAAAQARNALQVRS
jgi:hypothetical protein